MKGNGILDSSKLENMMRSLDQNPTDEEIQDMIAEFDVNKDGVVSAMTVEQF